ncbi:MAG: amino acid ABC transporter permease [Candidatus Adiutrix sp.]|jgi:polar amino acid transport system permease protein|nr:amino acid ABC transporter permease [Candidatus Adiutrix sp.]
MLVFLAAALGWLAWRVLVDFKYDWQWADIPQYILHRDSGGRFQLGTLGQGLALTLRLSVWASALGLALGLGLALARLGASLYLRLAARSLVELSRNIPPLVLLLVAFYFFGAQALPWPRLAAFIRDCGPGVQWLAEAATVRLGDLDVFFPAVAALAIYEAAYFSEIFRGAIQAADRGQWEAAWCLGLSRLQQYRLIVLPQVFRKTAPQLAGQFISTLKESSVVSVLSLAELTYSSMKLAATIHHLFEIWLTAAAMYFIFNFLLSLLFARLERA